MDFKLDEAELLELAQIEAETNCDIGAGFDWGPHLGRYLALATHSVDHEKLLSMLREGLGDVLSPEELEDAARSFQEQLRTRVLQKLQVAKSA